MTRRLLPSLSQILGLGRDNPRPSHYRDTSTYRQGRPDTVRPLTPAPGDTTTDTTEWVHPYPQARLSGAEYRARYLDYDLDEAGHARSAGIDRPRNSPAGIQAWKGAIQ